MSEIKKRNPKKTTITSSREVEWEFVYGVGTEVESQTALNNALETICRVGTEKGLFGGDTLALDN